MLFISCSSNGGNCCGADRVVALGELGNVVDDENWTDEVNVTLAVGIDNEGIVLLNPTFNK